ncbi:hypothetical protein CTZ27_03120 [Streptomyces griseocarneus]|nr:hypothetical protein CTZ27_03120 [Streptomyces griseocarneus]
MQPDRGIKARSPERETVQERLRVYLPWAARVDSADRLRIEERWYEVDGEPLRWSAGRLQHVTVWAWRVQH